MATITKRIGKKGTSFRAEVRRKNYPEQVKTFKRRSDAEKWARKIEREMDTKTWRDYSGAESLLLSDALQRYLDEVSIKKRPNTQIRDKYSAFYLKEKLGTITLLNISKSDVAQYRDKRLAEQASPHSVRIELSLLSHLFNVARNEWNIGDILNPVSLTKKPTLPEDRLPVITTYQIDKLLTECKKSRTTLLHPFVLLALHTGCRSMESRGLRWEQVNLDATYISLLGEEVKTHRSRLVPLTETAKRILEDLKRESRGADINGDPIGLVFPSRGNSEKPRDMHMAFNRAVKRAGLGNLPGLGKLRIHDLRHICGSYLVMTGVDLETIRKILGHRFITTTQKYLHVDINYMKSSINKIDGLGTTNIN